MAFGNNYVPRPCSSTLFKVPADHFESLYQTHALQGDKSTLDLQNVIVADMSLIKRDLSKVYFSAVELRHHNTLQFILQIYIFFKKIDVVLSCSNVYEYSY